MIVTSDMVGKRRFLMHDVEYPLEGTIELRIDCSTLPPILDTRLSSYLVGAGGALRQLPPEGAPEQTQPTRRVGAVLRGAAPGRAQLLPHRDGPAEQSGECAGGRDGLQRPFAVLSVADICSREIPEARDKWTEDLFVFYFDYVSTSGNEKIISRRWAVLLPPKPSPPAFRILLGTDSEAKCTEWRCRLNGIIKLLNGK